MYVGRHVTNTVGEEAFAKKQDRSEFSTTTEQFQLALVLSNLLKTLSIRSAFQAYQACDALTLTPY